MVAQSSYIDIIRPRHDVYNWTGFPPSIDLVVIHRTGGDMLHVFCRHKPLSSNRFACITATLDGSVLKTSIESIVVSHKIKSDMNQTILKLIQSYYEVDPNPKTIQVQSIGNAYVRQLIRDLPEYNPDNMRIQAFTYIDPTVIALLRYSKDTSKEGYKFEDLKKALDHIYGRKETEADIARIILKKYLEILDISDFKLPLRNDIHDVIDKLIFSTIDNVTQHLDKTKETAVDLKSYYHELISYMLDEIAQCNITWCRHVIYPESKEPALQLS